MRRHKPCVNRQSGMSLISVLVSVAIMGFVVSAMSQFLGNSFAAKDHFENELELNALRHAILNEVSCSKTLKQAGITLESAAAHTSTTKTQKGPYLRLYRKMRDPAAVRPLTGAVAAKGIDHGAGELNGWLVRTSFSNVENSLIVKVAKVHKGKFVKDRLTGKELNFDNPDHQLFGGKAGRMPLCGVGTGTDVAWVPVACSGWKIWEDKPSLQQASCTTAGNVSPGQICANNGYATATSACRGSTNQGFQFFGSISANNSNLEGLSGWAITCNFGNPFYWPPAEIECIR